ncbi:Uncharacterised protein [Mycobacteroides abscessus subsp. abscessus]|nr:Uncharacterised protein [Mycobacteroides abscessus subsp. abscessus]
MALYSLVAKLRDDCAWSSPTEMSDPGFAPRASVNRSASAPKRSTQSRGSMPLPRDFDILRPCSSRTSPCRNRLWNGTFLSASKSLPT